MKYLKYFENIDEVDPFGEEEWEEEDTAEQSIYRIKIGAPLYSFRRTR